MSCSPFDLKDFFLQELANPQRLQVEEHVRQCAACSEELDRLRIAQAALFSIPDEEIPQRIAFVSDEVFEPSPLRRWLAAFWGSTPRLGFASAALLSAALVVFALNRPAPVFVQSVAPVKTISEAEIQARVDAAVVKAVSVQQARQSETTLRLVKDLEERAEREHRLRLIAEVEESYRERRSRTALRAASDYGAPAAGDPQ